jgi:Glyoxalase-like domain
MSCQLDHIAIIAPSLKAGIVWVRECLGLMPQMGGQHPQMGTQNMLLRLGADAFLEVIAVDPNAPKPDQARWFGLDDTADVQAHWQAGRRLRGMVARTDTLADLTNADAALHGQLMRITRGDRAWQFGVRPDGRLPMDGAVPHLMDWGAQGPAAPQMPDLGCALLALVLETPMPAAVSQAHQAMGLTGGPSLRQGPHTKLSAIIQTPTGIHLLT